MSVRGACRRGVALGALSAATVVTGMLVAGGGVALAATMSRGDPRTLTRSGMDKFRKDEVEASIEDFDAVIAAAPQMRPYMWQRGLSLYYVGEPRARHDTPGEGGGGSWVAQMPRDDVHGVSWATHACSWLASRHTHCCVRVRARRLWSGLPRSSASGAFRRGL